MIIDTTNVTEINKDDIQKEANNMKLHGYRFVTLNCAKEGENYEFLYHFDLNYKLKNLKMIVEPESHVKSISSIYPSAFLIENEYQDLYGFTFDELTIDYKGRLYLAEDAPKTPMLQKK